MKMNKYLIFTLAHSLKRSLLLLDLIAVWVSLEPISGFSLRSVSIKFMASNESLILLLLLFKLFESISISIDNNAINNAKSNRK
jgi:hypothetical protein